MVDEAILAFSTAIEQAARGREASILIPDTGDPLASPAADELLSAASVERSTVRAWLLDEGKSGEEHPASRAFCARKVAEDLPRPGWQSFLIRRKELDDDDCSDYADARAYHREAVRLSEACHDVRGTVNSIALMVELASRKARAVADNGGVSGSLEKVRELMRSFSGAIDGLQQRVAPCAREDWDLRELVDRIRIRHEALRMDGSLRVSLPDRPVPVHVEPRSVRSGLVDAILELEQLSAGRGPVIVELGRDEAHGWIDLSRVVEGESTDVENPSAGPDPMVLKRVTKLDGGEVEVDQPRENVWRIRATFLDGPPATSP